MATSYCDRYDYFRIYGHYPPEDGSYDPALGGSDIVMGIHKPIVETKVVAAVEEPKLKTSRVAETK